MQGRRSFKIAIVRHAERADHVFGHEWTRQFFDAEGNYVRADLNLPCADDMPKRPVEDWAIDPPITELGRWQARQVGSALGSLGQFHAIVCSPALRCLQTAEEIRRALPTKPGVVTEPGLYEMTSWGNPKILQLFKQNSDQYSITTIPPPDEGVEAWYERSAKVFSDIVERHQHYGKSDLLIIAHGLSHEVLTYRMLWQNGTIPLEVQQAPGHEAKIQTLCNSGRCGLSPVESFCGAAVLELSADGVLTPASNPENVPLWLTHRQNLPFAFTPFSDAARHLPRSLNNSFSESTSGRRSSEQPNRGQLSPSRAPRVEESKNAENEFIGSTLLPSFAAQMRGPSAQIPRMASSDYQLQGSFVHPSTGVVQVLSSENATSSTSPTTQATAGGFLTQTQNIKFQQGTNGSQRHQQSPATNASVLGSLQAGLGMNSGADLRRAKAPIFGAVSATAASQRVLPGTGSDNVNNALGKTWHATQPFARAPVAFGRSTSPGVKQVLPEYAMVNAQNRPVQTV